MGPRSETQITSDGTYPVSSKKMEAQTPFLMKFWASLYRSIPKIYVPFTQIDVTFTIVSALWFIMIRIMIEKIQISAGWPVGSDKTKEAAACLVGAFAHSPLLVSALGVCLYSTKMKPSAKFSLESMVWQDCVNALLQYCTGYMIYDALINIVLLRWEPGFGPMFTSDDISFLLHHMVTTFYMTSTRIVGAGQVSAMWCMFLGELTNPIQNSWWVLRIAMKLDCCKGDFTLTLYKYVEFAYAVSYFFVRTFLAGWLALYLTYDLLITKQGRANIPIVLSTLWVLMVWGIVHGSIPWVQECLEMAYDGLVVKYHPHSEF